MPERAPSLPLDVEEPHAFAEPWHAQLFAITVRLSEAGHFTWPEWADIFAAELKTASEEGAPKDGSAYYDTWLAALERMLAEKGLANDGVLSALKQAWTEAYLRTPHGRPVHLLPADTEGLDR